MLLKVFRDQPVVAVATPIGAIRERGLDNDRADKQATKGRDVMFSRFIEMDVCVCARTSFCHSMNGS